MELHIDISSLQNYMLYYLSYWGTKSSPSHGKGIAYFYFKAEWHTLQRAEQHFVRDRLVLSNISMSSHDVSGGFLIWKIRLSLHCFLLKVLIL